MSRVELSPDAEADIERILDHLILHDVANAADRVKDILDAISILHGSPLIGRPAEGGKRELLIGRRSRSYAVLYRYVQELDLVVVLGVRGQREAGYR